jgi:hypothetical protein
VLQWAALDLQPRLPDLSQILPAVPFPLMIFMLVLVNLDSFRRSADRHPALGRFPIGDPPSAIGTAFRRE